MDKKEAIKRKVEIEKELNKLIEIINAPDKSDSIMDKVKTFEDACKIRGIDSSKSLPYSNPSGDSEKALNAIAMLWIIAGVVNEGWIADYSNASQYKWFPYFEKTKSGFGFSSSSYVFWLSSSFAGSRFAFETEEKAKYVGKQFINLYNQFL